MRIHAMKSWNKVSRTSHISGFFFLKGGVTKTGLFRSLSKENSLP